MLNDTKKKLGINFVKHNTVFLKDGTLLAVFSVKPVNFNVLSEKKQLETVCRYRLWLDSLNYPVQIVARTVNTDLDKQMTIFRSNTEKEIKSKKDYYETLSRFYDFYHWLEKYIEKNCYGHRLYYLVIPYIPSKYDKREQQRYLNLLEKRVEETRLLLEKTKIKLHRLTNEDLDNMYTSYFSTVLEQRNKPNFLDLMTCLKIYNGGIKNVI